VAASIAAELRVVLVLAVVLAVVVVVVVVPISVVLVIIIIVVVIPVVGVGIATGYGLTTEGSELKFRWGQEFSLLHVVQTCSGVHPTSYPIGTGGSFPLE
jgi:hypothetical protein